jgi:hypothetical protein
MDKIIDNLYLGDLNDASHLFRLKQHVIIFLMRFIHV